MPRVTKKGNANILKGQQDFFEIAKKSLRDDKDIPDIVTFTEHTEFLGKPLFPRQRTLLKLINLELDNLTDYDMEVIEGWTKNFYQDGGECIGISPDIMERAKILKADGYNHFKEVINITGRRGGKGHIGGIQGAYINWQLLMLDDPQYHYGIDKSKDMYLFCVATNIQQAKQYQFADLSNTIIDAPCFQPYIADAKDHFLALRTPSDIRRIATFESRGIRPNRLIASIRNMAVTSNSKASRGAAAFSVMFDEFAHMLVGTDGSRTSEQVYSAITPALDQFGKDGFIYIPTSPFCLVPETPVLLEDLTWAPVGSLKVGDKLIGFDEYAPGGKGNGRSWRQAIVEETSIINAPTLKLKTDGPEVVCTGEHLWLTKKPYASQLNWVKTKNLKPGDMIRYTDTWEIDKSYDAGYLSGMFDGEGYYSKHGLLGIAQNKGPVLDNLVEMMIERGCDISTTLKEEGRDCIDITVNGGSSEKMKFLGSIRPRRLLAKFTDQFYGTRIYDKTSKYVTVESIEDAGNRDVVALGTSTSTLLAAGMFSHNTKIGKAYDLYESALSLEDDKTPSYPNMMMIQLPSWGPYEDWADPRATFGGFKFNRAPQEYDNEMKLLEKREPDTFRVERKSQWAEVTNAYLNPKMVERMFDPFVDSTGETRVLEMQPEGMFNITYYGHCDPSKSGANTASMICHVEKMADPDDGEEWYHIIVDWMKVWNPDDYTDGELDYEEIEEELVDILSRYRTTKTFSFDQYGAFVTLPRLKRRLKQLKQPHKVTVKETKFTKESNMRRAERFKSALGMGWVHSYKDEYGPNGTSLLEQELKFLQEINGRVDKQKFGPIRTSDISDCLMVCVDALLEDNFIKIEMRERLKNTDLHLGAHGGYHTGAVPGWGQLSSRDKLKTFGAVRSQRDYGGMNRGRGR